MTDTPFLIAHKVRGEPAFDIAIKQRCAICSGVGGHNVPDFETGLVSDYEGSACNECDGEGFWWICSTSGHRAYPWWSIPLDYLNSGLDDGCAIDKVPEMPPGIPDHYTINASPKAQASTGRSLLAALGLGRSASPIKRRI